MTATPDLAGPVAPAKPKTQRMHPAFEAVAAKRAASAQLRIADAITAFAGSMKFVYVHVVLFAAWMIIFERSPWPTLTLVVSLEAIFLSTFVMIGQNRAGVLPTGQGHARLQRAGAGAQDQHPADPGDPYAHRGAAQAPRRAGRPRIELSPS